MSEVQSTLQQAVAHSLQERPMEAFADSSHPGPGPVLQTAPPTGAWSEHPGHPGVALNSRPPSWAVVRSLACPTPWPPTTCQPPNATSHQATIPGPYSLRALTGVPSCATRARRVCQNRSARPSGSVFTLEIGAFFTLGVTCMPRASSQFASVPGNGRYAENYSWSMASFVLPTVITAQARR